MNNQKDKNEKLEMIDLNKPASQDGSGVFFVVCRLAIANTSWARKDFKVVELAEKQLKYLEDYCKQEFNTTEQSPEPLKNPQEATPEEKAGEVVKDATPDPKADTDDPVAKEETPEDQKKNNNKENEEIDPHDKGEKRNVPMPDSILDKVKMGVEASKYAPKVSTKGEKLPKTKEEYDEIF